MGRIRSLPNGTMARVYGSAKELTKEMLTNSESHISFEVVVGKWERTVDAMMKVTHVGSK